MNKSRLKAFAITCTLALFATAANANSVSLSGPGSVTAGVAFDVDILGDFGTDGLNGGGVTMLWDTTNLVFNSFTHVLPNADLTLSCPDSGAPPCAGSATSQPVSWASFNFGAQIIAPGAGIVNMGTANFTLASGAANLSLADLGTGWLTAGFAPQATPDFFGTSVSAGVIPVPAAVWLFGSGLLGLIGVARRRNTA